MPYTGRRITHIKKHKDTISGSTKYRTTNVLYDKNVLVDENDLDKEEITRSPDGPNL